MVDEGYADDDIEKMLKEIYLQAQEELEKSTADMMQQIDRQASEERRASMQRSAKRPFRFLFDRMKAIKEKRHESPPKSLVQSGSEDSFGSRRSSTNSGDSGSLSVRSRLGIEEEHRRKKILAIYKNADWNAEEKYRKVQVLMTEDEKRIVQQKGDRLRRKNIGSIYEDKSLTPEEKMGEIFELNQIYENHFSDPADTPMEEKLQKQESRAPQEFVQVTEAPTGTFDEPGDSRSYSGSRSYSDRTPSRSRGGSRSYSGSASISYSRSRRSSSYSRSDSRSYSSDGSRSSYSSRSRSPDGSRSFYSDETSPSRQPQRAPEEDVPSLAPKAEQSDADSSDLSSDNGRTAKCSLATIAIVVCLIIGAGLGIGFGVAAANKKDQPAAANNGSSNSTGSDKDDKGVIGGTTLLDSKEYFLFGGEEMATTTEAIDVAACLEFCKEYDAIQYLYVEDSCACYNSVSCLMPWGPKVDTSSYQFVGDLYVKDELEECSEDYCQALDDKDGLCFTANSQNYLEYSLHGENMVEREKQQVETLEECLDLCSPYDAASFLNWKDCTCYDQAECWLEWGASVETQLLLGTVYSKKPLDVCAETYCQVNKDASCFSANRKDAKEYTVYGAALIEHNSTSASSEEECLELCAPYDAASFRRPNVCTCFENPTCWVEWGNNVDTQLFFGNIFSKTPLDSCLSDYCELNTEDALCFTGNKQDCRDYALYGESMFQTASERTEDLQKCLDLCAPYDAASFGNFADCGCYNFAQCWLRWGDNVNSDNIIGTVYSKQSLQECPQDLCDTVGGVDGRCFTGNTQAYRSYSLFGSNMEEVASSNDVNNKEECLDFCKKSDAAQFLNFQDPKCKCFTGAECWLAWPDQTDTSGALFTGDVYSKKELRFCG